MILILSGKGVVEEQELFSVNSLCKTTQHLMTINNKTKNLIASMSFLQISKGFFFIRPPTKMSWYDRDDLENLVFIQK